jgi:exodeoxyribonuclease VII large subunit
VTRRLARAIQGRLREDRATADRLRAKLSDPRFVLAEKQQYLDEYQYRVERALRRALSVRRTRLDGLRPRLMARHPRTVVARAEARLQPLTARLGAATMSELRDARHTVSELSKQLHALSPLAVLGRGYAIALRADGRAVRRPADVVRGDALRLRLAQGQVTAVVEDTGGTDS